MVLDSMAKAVSLRIRQLWNKEDNGGRVGVPSRAGVPRVGQ